MHKWNIVPVNAAINKNPKVLIDGVCQKNIVKSPVKIIIKTYWYASIVIALSSEDIFFVITITIAQKKDEPKAIETPNDISIKPGLIITSIPTKPNIRAIDL